MSTVFGVRTGRGRETVREVFSGHRVSSLSPDEAQRAHRAGYQPSSADDWLIGRDPREMSPDELRAMGHKTMSPVAAIRLKCLDCAGSSDESADASRWRVRRGRFALARTRGGHRRARRNGSRDGEASPE